MILFIEWYSQIMKSSSVEKQILDAAEAIMSEKGLVNTSIAEIARKAGVTDSLIYTYFKGKEDVLFSIPGRRMKEVLADLSEQLQGILDPMSKLSKMIWFHLHFNDTYRGYARLLLLECRSNRSFYHHNAYTLIREYAGIMLNILEDGAKKRMFRDDVSMRLIRDMIFGLLDCENLSSLASHEIEDTISDFESILDLILPMIVLDTSQDQYEVNKSSRILQAAESLFAEKGYPQTTIAEIAKLSNVSEGTVYEYFKNKEDLLLSIPEQRLKEHINALAEIFEIRSPIKKLHQMIRYHFFLYLTEPDFSKVFLLHIQLSQRFYDSRVYRIFLQYTNTIDQILEEGKKDGSIRMNVNNRVFRNLFIGSFSHLALRWLILGVKRETDKMAEIDAVSSLLTRAVTTSADGESRRLSVKKS
jgi:TetR/AcrR family fatty acid metabolism transcriptional regulator